MLMSRLNQRPDRPSNNTSSTLKRNATSASASGDLLDVFVSIIKIEAKRKASLEKLPELAPNEPSDSVSQSILVRIARVLFAS